MNKKKKKLKLDELKVQSFVTSFDSLGDETEGIKGGNTIGPTCTINPTDFDCDPPSEGSCQYSCGNCTEPVEE